MCQKNIKSTDGVSVTLRTGGGREGGREGPLALLRLSFQFTNFISYFLTTASQHGSKHGVCHIFFQSCALGFEPRGTLDGYPYG